MVIELFDKSMNRFDYPTWHWTYCDSFTKIKVRGPSEALSFSFIPRTEETIEEDTDFRLWIAEKLQREFRVRGIIEIIHGE